MTTPKWERMLGYPAVIAAIVAGIAATIAAVSAGIITSRSSEEQLEGNLIIEAVKVCNKRQATDNLRFLIAAGFLPNHSEGINAAIKAGLEKMTGNCPPQSK